MSDQNKLTPELFSKNNGIYFSPGDIVEGGFYGISHSDFMEYVDQFYPQTAAKDERIKELEGQLTQISYKECPDCVAVNRLSKWDYAGLECCCPTCQGEGKIKYDKVTRIAELEKVKDTYKADFEAQIQHTMNAKARIAEMEPELILLRKEYNAYIDVCNKLQDENTELLEKVEQLEKLVAMFKEVPYGSAYIHVSDYCLAVGRILEQRDTLLSSRENKKQDGPN